VHPEVLKTARDTRLDKNFPNPELKAALEGAIKEFKQTSNYS
jgi:F-type H+-transporting ATPase subunit alpha